jgi:Ca2+-binding RTX toxin-like protein
MAAGRSKHLTRATLVALALAASVPLVGSGAPQQAASDLCMREPATILGTSGDDQLNGTSADDIIVGVAGNDRITGGGGNDLICGGLGNDRLEGGTGNDLMDGGAGDDQLAAGPGINVMDGGAGDDTIAGGPGIDAAIYVKAPAAVGVDLRRGQATGWGTDRLAGLETVLGSRFGDVLTGDGGRNRLSGDRGNDRLNGLAGGDLLDGGPDKDVVDGGSGRDLCITAERSVRCP